MPDPETKTKPRELYGNMAVLNHIARKARSYVVAVKDDGRHMFFQFELSPEDEWTCTFTVILELDGVLWFVLIVATCMNMGTRNASKVATRFSNEWLEAWARRLDLWVWQVWIHKQTPALRDLLQERKATLGVQQARPFFASSYTDDYLLAYVGAELGAVGTSMWRSMNTAANYWLSDKSGAGTLVDVIG